MMDDEVIDGEVIEPAEGTKSKLSASKRGNGRKVQMPKSGSDAKSQPADLDSRDRSDAVPGSPVDHDFHPLIKARAQEFARRHEAMTRAYEQAMFGTMTDAVEAVRHQHPVEEPPKAPLVSRLASSCGEALMQAGRRLAQAAEPDSCPTASPDPKEVEGGPTIIVFNKDGGIDG